MYKLHCLKVVYYATLARHFKKEKNLWKVKFEILLYKQVLHMFLILCYLSSIGTNINSNDKLGMSCAKLTSAYASFLITRGQLMLHLPTKLQHAYYYSKDWKINFVGLFLFGSSPVSFENFPLNRNRIGLTINCFYSKPKTYQKCK